MPTLSLRFLADSSPHASRRSGRLELALIAIGGFVVAVFILKPELALLAAIACLALGFLAIASRAFRGKSDEIILWWTAIFPLGYYFVSFPREQAVITLDRLVVFLAFFGLFIGNRDNLLHVPKMLRNAGFAWLLFAVVAGITAVGSPNFLNAARALFDSFLLPVLLAWCVIAHFDVRRHLPALHAGVCVSSVICALIAAAEIAMSQDLLSVGGPAASYAGIIRPNGPFEANDTLSLVGAVSLFFLLFLRAALGPYLPLKRRILHAVGVTAAVGMALLPLFRSVALTLLLVLVIDLFWERGLSRRAWRIVCILAFVGTIAAAALLTPQIFQDRSSGENVYGRVAQFKQSVQVFAEKPLWGVGFMNFHEYVAGEPRFVATYEGVTSVDWPHDNLLEVLTETGIVGFLPYLLAQIFLLAAIWRLRRRAGLGHLAWRLCIYLFLTYWITGLTESSGYGPLNLWYAFAIAVLYKHVLTEPALAAEESYDEDSVHGDGDAVPRRVVSPVFPS